MRRSWLLSVAAFVSVAAACCMAQEPAAPASRPAEPTRGTAVARETRPARFPHRIWAACDYEAHTVTYGWFGISERKDLPAYPGNTAARRAEPFRQYPMKYVGCNPVPGPMMGKVNKMYCRYKLWGTDQAQFQHYSLTCSDNCNIRVSGLTTDKWTELTLNFTADSKRNDGSPGAFKEGERMDDLKIFIRDPKNGADYGMIIDDVIFFAEDPAAPPEPEPFPNRVIYLAAFDTGTFNAENTQKFFPGEFEVANQPPKGAYWVAAKAVSAGNATSNRHVVLKLQTVQETTFHAGAHTKLRFRYWVKGAPAIVTVLHNKTRDIGHVVQVLTDKQGQWITRYVDFGKEIVRLPGEEQDPGPAAGDVLDELRFLVPGDAELYVDEIVLYDAGKATESP
jgi:hypothetical protein